MDSLIGFTLDGIALGAIYAIAATGLVVTYTTSGVFNFAHGAVGMLMAFVYWQLRVQWHWAAPWALILTLVLIAPALGVLIERVMIRRVDPNDTGMTLVVTLGLLAAGIGVAYVLWPPSETRVMPPFLGVNAYVTIAGNRFAYANLIAIGLAVATAVGLRILFYRTRVGLAMRAVVDDRPLLSLNGGRPARVNALSWAIGTGLGGLAGVLQVSTGTTSALDVLDLTLLVINAFSAAMLGRLKNLPLTFVGALALGLLDAYVTGYVPLNGALVHLQPVLPTFFLLVILLVLRPVRLKAGAPRISRSLPVPGLGASVVYGAGFLAVAAIAGVALPGTPRVDVAEGLALGVVGLSVVLLTGYGGEVSLVQYAFMGMGAWLFVKITPGGGVLGLVAVAACGAAMGVLVALPTIRLRGLYLALSTLAIAELAYYMIFEQPAVMGGGDLAIPPINLFGLSLAGPSANLFFEAVVFVLAAIGLLALKRGEVGRLLSATQDSAAACATLGVNLPLTRLLLFAASASIATVGGALYGSTEGSVSALNYYYVAGLFIVLAVYLWGIRSVTGALLGGLSLTTVFPLITPHIPARWGNVQYLATGVGVLMLTRAPNGVVGQLSERWQWVRENWLNPTHPPAAAVYSRTEEDGPGGAGVPALGRRPGPRGPRPGQKQGPGGAGVPALGRRPGPRGPRPGDNTEVIGVGAVADH